MKRVLITGAAGFAGRHLAEHLNRLRYQVVETARWDIRDRLKTIEVFKKNKPDFIVHLAAQTVPALSWKQEAETFEINTGGTLNLLDAIRISSPHAKLLFVSSSQVYGRTFAKGKRVLESDRLWPENPYAASKAAAELACRDFGRRFGLNIVIARSFNHTGPGQRSDFVFSDWCRQIARAEKKRKKLFLEVGNLDVERDYLHVGDVVRAYEVLLRKGKSGEIYNVCAGRPLRLRKAVDFLRSKAKTSLDVRVMSSRLRSSEPARVTGNVAKLKRLGWKPRRTVFQALTELLGDWRGRIS